MPAGGVAAQQPVPPAGEMTPADIAALVEQMVPAVARFRQQASPLEVPLDTQTLGLGGQAGIRIASVGLGYDVITHVTAIVTLNNTAAGQQVVQVSPRFPYNLLQNTQVQINGGATVYSAGGMADLSVAARTRRGFWIPSQAGGFGPALNPAWCQIGVAGTGVAVQNAGFGVAGLGTAPIVLTAALSPAAVAANTTSEQLFTIPGIAAGDFLLAINKPTQQAGLAIAQSRITAAGQLAVTFINDTGLAITPTAAESYSVIVYRAPAVSTPGLLTPGALSGIASIIIPGATTATITADFYLIEKLALDRDSLLGALPLQNNSTYATLTRTVAAALGGGNATFPFFVAGGIPATLTLAVTSVTIKSTYQFWSVPADPGLYAEMVSNSYQVQEQTAMTVSATGPGALSYNIPQNQYLVAVHLHVVDGSNNVLAQNRLTFLKLQYNAGGVIPVQRFQDRMRAFQFSDYGADTAFVPGYFLWDGDETTEAIVDTDQAGWVDAYAAATPQFLADVDPTVVTPLTFSLTREAVVAGAVQVVGG